jgi:hypothetical protein
MEYLIAHVRARPVMLVALARPGLLQRRSTWGAEATTQTTHTAAQPVPWP